jgi:hypothetical protein
MEIIIILAKKSFGEPLLKNDREKLAGIVINELIQRLEMK